jgi:hypothetical protein
MGRAAEKKGPIAATIRGTTKRLERGEARGPQSST